MAVEPMPSTSSYTGQFESTLVLYKSLLNGPFPHLAVKLEQEINSSEIIPKRTDFDGNEHRQTLREYLKNRSLVAVSSIQILLEDTKRANPIGQNLESLRISRFPSNAHLPSKKTSSHARLLSARSLGSVIPEKRFHDLNMIEHSLNYQYRITGHIDKTYNVRFDKTGRYIVTASDDAIMKVWDLNSAMLRYSFRGHPSLISDMDISFCNQFVASVGHDKVIRIWSFQTGAQVEVCRHHTNYIASISFLPMVYGTKRWLVSFGNDCNVIFYEFDEQRKVFNDRAVIFNVRTAPGLKVLSGTHSPCGNWVAAGDSHGYVHLFRFQENYVVDLDFKAIPVQEKLDTLEWSNTGLSFVASSSRYHAGRIWRYINNMWRYLEFAPKLPDDSIMGIFHSAKLKYGICMAIWSLDDSKIIVSGTDFKIRIFDSYTAEETFCLSGHKAEAFHLKCHPVHVNVAVSSAHDGFVIVWDIEKGKVIKKFINEASDDDGDVISSAILDCSFSPDGTVLAVVDDLGRLTVYGYGGSDGYKTPKEQFFSSDYELIEIDDHEFPMDSSTGLAPHLNNPPWLVDIQRIPYEEKWQKKVPGRETDSNNIICPWLTRDVAPKLDEGILNVWTDAQKFFPLENEMHLDSNDGRLKAYKVPGTEEPAPVKTTASTRRRAPIPTVEQVLQEQQQRYMQDNLMGYRSEDDEDYQNDTASERGNEGNVTSCESDTSDESYEGERINMGESQEEQRTVTTSSGRRVRSRNPNFNTSPTRPPRRTRRNHADAQDDAIECDEDTRDGPMTEEEPSASIEQKKVTKERKKKGLNPELATFPYSMQIVKPTRFPYVAQLGDKVVYCKQGHLTYLARVEQLNLYPISTKMRPQPELKAEEFCIVDEVKYTRKPYRLTCLRLAQLTRHNERSGYTFNVKYHDLQDSPDFIILRQQYDSATTNALQEGNEMEAILDGLWWTGTVTKKQAVSEEFPNSHWNCLAVRWDNGDEDSMSPWDCQPKTAGRKSGSPATAEDEIQLGTYIPIEDDWPGNERPQGNMETHCERLYVALNNLSCVETVVAFAYPVNLSDFPTYALSVDYCVDLQTIAERLKNHFYRSMKAVQHDIRHIAVAAEQFNEPSSVIVRNSRRLVEALLRFSADTYVDPVDIVKFYDSMFDLPDEEIVEYRQRDIRRELEAEIVQMASSSQAAAPVEAGWIKDARSKLQTAFNQACAKPFFDKDEAGNHAVCVALAETGDLKSVLNELHLFSHPSGVIKKIATILDGCREAIDDPRSRLNHSVDQVMKLVEQKMKSVVEEFNRISEVLGVNVRSLRKRTKRSNAYQTRSHVADSSGSGRAAPEPGSYDQLASGRITTQDEDGSNRPLRASRRHRVNFSEEVSREATVEREPARASQRRSTRSSGESQQGPSKEVEDSEGSEYMEAQASSSMPSRRKQQRFKEELEEELRELQEDAEERLETKRITRNKKRKRYSTESDEDCFSNDSARSSQRPTRRSTRLKRDDSDDDDDKINVSQYGRIRRSRRLD